MGSGNLLRGTQPLDVLIDRDANNDHLFAVEILLFWDDDNGQFDLGHGLRFADATGYPDNLFLIVFDAILENEHFDIEPILERQVPRVRWPGL